MRTIYARFVIATSERSHDAAVIEWLKEKLDPIKTRTVVFDGLVDEFNRPLDPEKPLTPAEVRARNYRQWGGDCPSESDPFDDPVR